MKIKSIIVAILILVPSALFAWPMIDPQCDPEPIECSRDHIVGPQDPRPMSVGIFDHKGGNRLSDSSFHVTPGEDPQGDVLQGPHMQAATMSTGNLKLEYGDIEQVGYAEMNNLIAIQSFFIFQNFGDTGSIGWPIVQIDQPGVSNCSNTCHRSCVYGQKANAMMVHCNSYEAVQCLCGAPQ